VGLGGVLKDERAALGRETGASCTSRPRLRRSTI
jgi:hypothetical protein